MAPSSSARPSGAPARPWALLWLGGSAAALWVPLLLADSLPWAAKAPPASLAATAPAAKPPAPLALPLAPPQPLLASLAPDPARLGARPGPALERAQGAFASFSPQEGAQAEPVAGPAPAPSTTSQPLASQRPLPGSVLLGGPLSLASLHEKPMVPAARIEQTLRARSTDRLQAVPLHWRPTMEALIQGKQKVMPAEVVRVPAPHLKEPEEYPMAVQSDGVAETSVTPSAPSRQALERWAERQSPTPPGTVRPVMLVLEPLAAEPPSPAAEPAP